MFSCLFLNLILEHLYFPILQFNHRLLLLANGLSLNEPPVNIDRILLKLLELLLVNSQSTHLSLQVTDLRHHLVNHVARGLGDACSLAGDGLNYRRGFGRDRDGVLVETSWFP